MLSTDKHRFLVVYFSGTGGVKKIAEEFENQLVKRNISVSRHSLDLSAMNKVKDTYQQIIDNTGLIILLYAVHAFDAPVPVFEWIEILPEVISLPVAVISVSGSGEVFLNRASRFQCIKALENKGYDVFYETMMAMPCNWWIPTPDHLAIRLIRSIPEKTEKILDEIVSGVRQRIMPEFLMRMAAAFISKLEKNGMKKFGQWLRVTNACTGCMWCVNNCPRENIQMTEGNPRFGLKCIMCLRCIYGCPKNAIYAIKGKFMIIKQGFNLDKLEKRMTGIELETVEKFDKDILWKGVVNYLLDKD